MRLLAEYIMQRRLQAVAIAILGSWIPVLSQAALALVTLRNGWKDGLLVTGAAITPSVIGVLAGGDIGRAFVLANVGIFFIPYCLALMLRWSASWSLTLICAVLLSVLVGVSLNVEEDLVRIYSELLSSSQQNNAQQAVLQEEMLESLNERVVLGFIAYIICLYILLGVVAGRWFQALLYNPGGFQEEFHGIRLHPVVALVFFVLASYCWYHGSEYFFWGSLFAVPLLVAGLSLAHHMVARLNWGVSTIGVMYFMLLIVSPLTFVVVLFGLTDAWVNYRNKFQSKQ